VFFHSGASVGEEVSKVVSLSPPFGLPSCVGIDAVACCTTNDVCGDGDDGGVGSASGGGGLVRVRTRSDLVLTKRRAGGTDRFGVVDWERLGAVGIVV